MLKWADPQTSETTQAHRRKLNPVWRNINRGQGGGRRKLELEGDYARINEYHGRRH